MEEYIEAQDETVQLMLREIRNAIPQAEECISWSMPTYRKGVNLIHFAASRHHLGCIPEKTPWRLSGKNCRDLM